MTLRTGIALALGSLVNAGYIFQEDGKPAVRMGSEVVIETPVDLIVKDTTTFYRHQPTRLSDAFPFPFAARFGWVNHDQGIVSCLVPGSVANSWSRVVQYTTRRDDASNPETGCQKNEETGVDCVNWVEPERLKEICIPLLMKWRKLTHQ